MATFELEPNAEVSGVGDGGDSLGPFTFDKNGRVTIPDDFQEAHRLLLSVGAKPIEGKSGNVKES